MGTFKMANADLDFAVALYLSKPYHSAPKIDRLRYQTPASANIEAQEIPACEAGRSGIVENNLLHMGKGGKGTRVILNHSRRTTHLHFRNEEKDIRLPHRAFAFLLNIFLHSAVSYAAYRMNRGYCVKTNSNQVDVRLLAVRLANLIGKPFGIDPFPRAFPNPTTGDLDLREDIFNRIYESNFWSSPESRSGVGSEGTFAAQYRRKLKALLDKRRLTRMFDAPCGDLNWISALANQPDFDYQGGDISPSLIIALQSRFPDINVQRFDICADPFPAAEVWHCRDCLFHLSFDDIHKALANFAVSEIPFALITTHKARIHKNLDVETGGFRYLDLERAPVGLPEADTYIKDFRLGSDFPRYVGLWRREAIAAAVEQFKSGFKLA
jgi:hypothetical protein